MLKIDNGRIQHMHDVAEYMYENAKDYELDNIKDKLYVIGLIHDVGSIINRASHEEYGADLLSAMGLEEKYVDIIRYHGSSPEQYCEDHNITEEDIPKELLLLWEADLHIGPDGQYMSFKERIDDMINTHKAIAEQEARYIDIAYDGRSCDRKFGYHS